MQRTAGDHRSTRRAASDSTGALFQLSFDVTMSAGRHHHVLVMVLVVIFFVSGADAASIVMGSLSRERSHEPRRATWCVLGPADQCVGRRDHR